jgi:hypoxanthine phosphoribosyltransferase
VDIGLVTLVVSDYDEAIDFYVERVGFDLVEDSPAVSTASGEAKRWVVVRPPGAATALLLAEASTDSQRAAVGSQTGGRVGFFLDTDDFDADYQRMVEAGVHFVRKPMTMSYGKVAVWEDLYGNQWDLIEPRPVLDASTFPPAEVIDEILLTEQQITDRVSALGAQIAADYADRDPLLVAVLKGSFVFIADLIRAIAAPVEVDFLAVSSYGAATKSSGVVRIVKDLDQDVSGRDVILVEDIVESGLTLRYLLDHLARQQAASVATCALLVREGAQHNDLSIEYAGFELPPGFVIGYGLDVAQRYRNMPYIATYAKADD